MTKLEFILQLHEKLADLPKNEVEERLTFYIEMIEDRMEEGLLEEDAVAAVGSVDRIAAQIIADISASTPTKEKPKQQRKLWEVILLVLGSPIWVSLLIAAFAVALSLYVSLWAIFASFAGCALGGVAGGIILACSGNSYTGVGLIAAGLVCAGLAIFLFYGCKAATKGTALLTGNIFRRLRNG